MNCATLGGPSDGIRFAVRHPMRHVLLLALWAVISGCGVATVGEEESEGARTAYRATQIEPFTTDGCSDFFDGVPMAEVKIWRHCCVIHDLRYWMGGMED